MNLQEHANHVNDCNGTLTYIAGGSSIFFIVSTVIVVGSYFGLWLGPETTDPAEIQKWRVAIALWVILLVLSLIVFFYAYYVWGKASKLAEAYAAMESGN